MSDSGLVRNTLVLERMFRRSSPSLSRAWCWFNVSKTADHLAATHYREVGICALLKPQPWQHCWNEFTRECGDWILEAQEFLSNPTALNYTLVKWSNLREKNLCLILLRGSLTETSKCTQSPGFVDSAAATPLLHPLLHTVRLRCTNCACLLV